MENTRTKLTAFDWWLLAVSSGCFILLASRGYTLYPDSVSYIDADITRSPPYPAFLKLCHFLFRDGWLRAAAITQTACAIGAAVWLTLTIKKLAALSGKAAAAINLILLAPLVKIPFAESFIANSILTDGPAYALWLCAVALTLNAYISPSLKKLCALAALAAAMAFMRAQFLFFYPVFLLFLMLLVREAKLSAARAAVALAALLGLHIAAGFADRAWHKAVNGAFTPSQLAWTQLMVPALYIADGGDRALFPDPADADCFGKAYTATKALNAQRREEANLSLPVHYRSNFDVIRFAALQSFGNCSGVPGAMPEHAKDTLAVYRNAQAHKLASPLLKTHWKAMAALALAQCLAYMPPFALLTLLLFAAGAVAKYRRENGPECVFVLLALCALAANAAILACAATVSQRYTFHAEAVAAAALLVFSLKIFVRD
jgi:O-antigen ligase